MLGKAHEQISEPDKFQLRMGLDQKCRAYLETYDRNEPWDTPEPSASMYSGTGMPEAIGSDMNEGSRTRGNLDDRFDD